MKTALPSWSELPYPQRVFFLLGLDMGRGADVDLEESIRLYEKMRSDINTEVER